MGKTFVLGASGYVGSKLADFLAEEGREVVRMGRSGCDIVADLRFPEDIPYDILHRDDFVIVAAAISSPDACKNDFDSCWNVNVTGTGRFIERCIEGGAKVLFLSSDAVYASDPGVSYDEDSDIDPKYPYGKMKAAIERRFASNPAFKALRLSYVFSPNDKFTKYLMQCAEKEVTAEVFHPYERNCVSLLDVERAVSWVLGNWNCFDSGVLNLAGAEPVSRALFATEFSDVLGVGLRCEIIEPPDSFYDSRPPATYMSSKFLYDLEIVQRGSFREKLAEVLEVQ